jgi:hypothetical protein
MAGEVVQAVKSTCLASMRPWVQTLVREKEERRKESWMDGRQREKDPNFQFPWKSL